MALDSYTVTLQCLCTVVFFFSSTSKLEAFDIFFLCKQCIASCAYSFFFNVLSLFSVLNIDSKTYFKKFMKQIGNQSLRKQEYGEFLSLMLNM